jgi:hypothetical protein
MSVSGHSDNITDTTGVLAWLYRHRALLLFVLAAALIVIASPLVFFWYVPEVTKDWADVVNHVFGSLAVLGGALAVIGWIWARMDRRSDVLISLHTQFRAAEMQKGKDLIERPHTIVIERRCPDLDQVLSFYVLLCGVKAAGEVPIRSLSICFRFWLAHYYLEKPDAQASPDDPSNKLRIYINRFYPTLRTWLLADADLPPEQSFFRPHDFWPAGEIEVEAKKLYRG